VGRAWRPNERRIEHRPCIGSFKGIVQIVGFRDQRIATGATAGALQSGLIAPPMCPGIKRVSSPLFAAVSTLNKHLDQERQPAYTGARRRITQSAAAAFDGKRRSR